MAQHMRVVILMGPPGAGKGTQADILVEEFKMVHLESSKVIEAQFNAHQDDETFDVGDETYTYGGVKKQWQSGVLVEPAVVSYWISQEIRHHAAEGASLVFSGSPRTMLEAKEQIPLHRELYGDDQMFFFHIGVPGKESIHRNSHRRVCQDCRTPIPFIQETEGLKVCPKCGGPIIRRGKLDDVETIKIRLVEFAERTLPIVEYIREQGLSVHNIDGMGTIEDVAALIGKHLPNAV